MKRISSVLTLGTCTLFAAAVYADDATPIASKWAPWIDGEWDPGTHRSIGLFDAFAPVMQDDKSLFFVNPRMRFDDQDSQEYNFGLGYRRMVDKDWIVGGYTYLDRTLSGFNNYFKEVTLGLEAINEDWKFRANDYQPFGVRSYSGQDAQAIVTSGNLEIQSDIERSMQGNDIEAGYRVPMHKASDPNQLWIYGGGYRFSAPDMRTVEGPRARFEYEIGDVTLADRNLRLRLSGEVQHDDVRGTQWFAGIRIGIPLGDEGATQYTSKLSPMERHMVDPVQRDVDIVTNKGGTRTEGAINTYNNETVSGITTVNAATSNIASAVTSAGSNSIVVFNGSNGTITLPANTSISMLTGETLLGGGSSLVLRGANSGVQAVYYAPGNTPTLLGTLSTPLVNLANSGVIKGFTVNNTNNAPSGTVIATNGATDVTIAENTIPVSAPGRRGIDASDSTGLITGNTLTATANAEGSNGIYALNAGALTISGNTLTFISNHNIFATSTAITADGTHLAINANTINIDTGTAIVVGSGPSATITNNILNLQSSGNSALTLGLFIDNSNDATISNNSFSTGTSVAAKALSIANSVGISVTHNTISGIFSDSPVTLGNATALSGSGNTFSPQYSAAHASLYAFDKAHLCDASSGTNNGSIAFVNGSHCP
jgi:hypothetical protein